MRGGQRSKRRMLQLGLLVAVAASLPAARAHDDCECPLGLETEHGDAFLRVTLTFEGLAHGQRIGDYPCTLAQFNPNWVAVNGSGPISNPPSPSVVASWRKGPAEDVTFAAPVAGVSLHFASPNDVSLEVFDVDGALLRSATAEGTNGFSVWSVVSVTGNRISRLRITNLEGKANKVVIDDLSYVVRLGVEVPVDVKPGEDDDHAPINLRSRGSLPVAVLTTDELDATTLEQTSLLLGDPFLTGAARVDRASVEDVDGDGRLDVVLHFPIPELVEAGAVDAWSTDLLLSGRALDGTVIFGSDRVRVVGKR